jgi:S1-C subfamily serine protease
MSVILSGSREVAWNPQPCNVIVVLSSRADGPMGALGLQDGDLVVAVDGAAIEGREQARILLAAAAVKDEVSLTVSRGTRTFELKIAGKVIGTAPGNFRPTVR